MFQRLFKRRMLPAAHRPALARDERVLAWAMTGADAAVIATNRGLWWGGMRTQWNEISKAGWDGDTLSVAPSEVVSQRDGYVVIEDRDPIRFTFTDPDHLPHEVRQRVTASVKHPAHHDFEGGGGVWLAGRKVPGVDGLSWIARYDAGTDRDDPEVMAATDAIVQETRSRSVSPDL